MTYCPPRRPSGWRKRNVPSSGPRTSVFSRSGERPWRGPFVPRRLALHVLAFAAVLGVAVFHETSAAESDGGWAPLFDGRSLAGWRAAAEADVWRVDDGCLVAQGSRSHLFYEGPVGEHDFRNFELVAEVRTRPAARSAIYFHTQFQENGTPKAGYAVEINNSDRGRGDQRLLQRTGSLRGVRAVVKSCVADREWFRVRIRVAGRRVCVWVNEFPTVDYLEPAEPYRAPPRAGRVLSHGTLALEGDTGSRVAFRSVLIRPLPDDAEPTPPMRPSDEGYGLRENLLDRLAGAGVPVIDFHVHLRGGMTVDKAIARQAVTGVNVGVLRNLGRGWPLETDEQLRAFLESVEGRPVFVGVQVNDRDWHARHAPELLQRLDYVLADTMIMPMPDDDGPPVKLWQTDGYTIDAPQAWMERYVRHNLRVLAEPVTILANPTYLPPPVAEMYDELWTDERMLRVIRAAVDHGVALEINARSGLPHDRFLRLARREGARFTFGTNNFHDAPIDMSRCFQSIERYGLRKRDMYVPGTDR